MKHYLLVFKHSCCLFVFFFPLLLIARPVQFKVDMAGQTISPAGVRVAGNFRNVNYDAILENPLLTNWDTLANMMSYSGVGAVYQITLNLMPGLVYEFKFLNGNSWVNVEPIPVLSRVNTTNDNRWVFVPDDSSTFVLMPLLFGQNAPAGKFAAQLSVDAKNMAIQPPGILIAGNFNSLAQTPISNYLTSGTLGGSIYRTIIYPDSGLAVTYKFLNGYNGWEEVPLRCGTGTIYNDRTFLADSNKVFATVCYSQCTLCTYPYIRVDTVQYVNAAKLSAIPANDSADYVSPIFAYPQYQDTVMFAGTVVFNPALYGLSVSRKSAFLQRAGGGPWSGVQVMLEPLGTGLSVSAFNTETQFYNKAKRGQNISVKGVIRQFQNETQVNILRNGNIDSSVISLTSFGINNLVYSPIPISALMTGGAGGASIGIQQKATGEKWEGVYVQLNNITVDTAYANGASRFLWKVKDAFGNAIWISDLSAFFRNDNNEDSAIANTFVPPVKGTTLSFIRGIVREVLVAGNLQYQLSPLYPEDISVNTHYPLVPIDTIQYVNASKLSAVPSNDSSDYVSPFFVNPQYQDSVMFTGTVVFNPAFYGLSTSRKATYLQRPGGGPWSGVQVLLEPAGTGLSVSAFNTETQFYNKTKGKQNISVKGVIRQFQNETQVNILRNGVDSSILVINDSGLNNIVYTPVPINELMVGGAGGNLVGVQQKTTGEKWEGVYVQFNNIVVDTVYASGSRFLWKVKDDLGNAIWISDFSAFFRNDNNEDSAIANTFAPPAIGTRLGFIRGVVREISLANQYQLAPLYPEDIGAVIHYPLVAIDTIQYVNATKLSAVPANDSSDYVSPFFVNPQYRDTVMFTGTVVFNPALYGLSVSRKAAFMQRTGGGPWSGVQVMLEPLGTGLSVSAFNTETQFYNKAKRGQNISVTGVIRQFQNETQVNILRNGIDSSIITINTTGLDSIVYTPVAINELMVGGAGGNLVGVQQKTTGEKWEGVYVQFNNIVVDTVYTNGLSRFLWKIKDDLGNAIWISDFSAFFRNDNNEDSAIANTFAPPAKGTRLLFIRGVVREALVSGNLQYQLSPLYPEDIGPINTIPVKLLGFTAARNADNILLQWATASEINSSHFEVERSLNNTDFESIGLVKSFGNSTIKRMYHLEDLSGPSLLAAYSTVYYRLKQVDFDHSYTYSKTAVVRQPESDAVITVVPNPANHFITISGLHQPAEITDMMGHTFLSVPGNGVVDISGLNNGLYFLRTGSKPVKFIKQ